MEQEKKGSQGHREKQEVHYYTVIQYTFHFIPLFVYEKLYKNGSGYYARVWDEYYSEVKAYKTSRIGRRNGNKDLIKKNTLLVHCVYNIN